VKAFDKKYYRDGIKLIAGVDEAGRGPLAGPVVAAAVIFPQYYNLKGVNDSKLLSAMQRELLFDKITAGALSYSVASVDESLIDEMNILNASLLAMKNAVDSLNLKPDLILVDGNRKFQSDIPLIPIVKGDAKSFSIAAASILAKVTRDRLMRNLSFRYPRYFWEQNKGYPTKQHREIIRQIGPCPVHRKTFLRNILNEHQLLEFSKNETGTD